MDTAEEASKRPMAISSGLRSGFAKATIFRKDEGPWGPLRNTEAKEARESFGVELFASGGLDESGGWVWVAYSLVVVGTFFPNSSVKRSVLDAYSLLQAKGGCRNNSALEHIPSMLRAQP